MASTILVVNGPNLNMLSKRDPEVYGSHSFAELEALCRETCDELGYACITFQSNVEGELIDCLQRHGNAVSGVLINPGGYAHTSVALRDALELCSCPIIEVHLSNLAKREAFRQITLTAEVVTGVVSGLGGLGYRLGLAGLAQLIEVGGQE